MMKEVNRANHPCPQDRFELFAYIVDFARELLEDTAMSLRLYGLVLVLAFSIGLLLAAVIGSLLQWHAVAGTSAALFVIPLANWCIQRIKQFLSSRGNRR